MYFTIVGLSYVESIIIEKEVFVVISIRKTIAKKKNSNFFKLYLN